MLVLWLTNHTNSETLQARDVMTFTETLFSRVKPRDQRPYIEFQGEKIPYMWWAQPRRALADNA